MRLGTGSSFASICALFFVGGIAGCAFAALANGTGALELCDYLTDYLALAEEGIVVRPFWMLLIEQIKYLLFIVLLGITAIGVFGIPVLFGVKGFFFAFSVGSFCRVFGASGFLPALILFGLPALLWSPALFLAGVQGMSSAKCFLRRGLGDTRCLLPFTSVYWLRIGLCVFLIVVCCCVEYIMVPVLLRAVAHFIV